MNLIINKMRGIPQKLSGVVALFVVCQMCLIWPRCRSWCCLMLQPAQAEAGAGLRDFKMLGGGGEQGSHSIVSCLMSHNCNKLYKWWMEIWHVFENTDYCCLLLPGFLMRPMLAQIKSMSIDSCQKYHVDSKYHVTHCTSNVVRCYDLWSHSNVVRCYHYLKYFQTIQLSGVVAQNFQNNLVSGDSCSQLVPPKRWNCCPVTNFRGWTLWTGSSFATSENRKPHLFHKLRLTINK